MINYSITFKSDIIKIKLVGYIIVSWVFPASCSHQSSSTPAAATP